MGYLDVATPIVKLSIPGTHDTCTKDASVFSECQSWTITDQLRAGIRFLDIRPRHFKDGLPIHHDAEYLNTNFGKVLQEVTDYLKLHLRETIFMRVKEEYTPEGNTRSFD